MGATIHVRCTGCSEERNLTPLDIVLRIPEHGQTRYTFVCPGCRRANERICPDSMIPALVNIGAYPLFIPGEDQLPIPERHELPISEQEIRDFQIALEMRPREAWLELYSRELEDPQD